MVARSKVCLVAVVVPMMVSGCVSPESYSTPDLPSDYRYVLTSSCGERPALGTFRVEVRDGAVISAEPMDAGTAVPKLVHVPTLGELVAKANDAGRGAEVEFVANPDGIPVTVDIDRSSNVTDDEECYQVADYSPLG